MATRSEIVGNARRVVVKLGTAVLFGDDGNFATGRIDSFISSIAGLRAYPARSTAYTTSKAAVIGLTMALAGQLGEQHVRVNCIAPGQVFTPLVAERLDAEGRKRRATSGLIKDEGSAWDIAWAAVYLASDEARWVTGQVLTVDPRDGFGDAHRCHRISHAFVVHEYAASRQYIRCR